MFSTKKTFGQHLNQFDMNELTDKLLSVCLTCSLILLRLQFCVRVCTEQIPANLC